MVDFSALKSHVNSSLVKGTDVLRLNQDEGESKGQIKLGSFFGRLASRILPGSRQVSSRQDNFEVKAQVMEALAGKFGDSVINRASSLIDWSPEKPLTAREVRVLIKTAESLQGQTMPQVQTSNHHAAHFGDGNRLGATTKLGAGVVNEVFSNTWMHRSEDRPMVFKPVGSSPPNNFPDYGIKPSGNGNIAGRNIASSEVAHALGIPSKITETHRTWQNGEEGIIMAKADGISVFSDSGRISLPTSLTDAQISAKLANWNQQLANHGLVIVGYENQSIQLEKKGMKDKCAEIIRDMQELIQDEPGISLSDEGNWTKTDEADEDNLANFQNSLKAKISHVCMLNTLPLDKKGRIDDGDLNLRLNQLQWLDFICAQTDRNPANIFISYGTDGVAMDVTGIDNDTSFGEDVHTFWGLDTKTGKYEGACQGMPKLVDEEMAKQIDQLTEQPGRDKFTDMLRANHLSPDEIAQTLIRLDDAKDTIDLWRSSRPDNICSQQSSDWSSKNTSGYSEYFARAAQSGNVLDPRELQKILQ